MTRFTSEYGQRVQFARVAAELSQTQLGELLGLTRSSIANIEAGRQAASAEQVVQTAAALNVSGHWLLTGEKAFAPPLHLTRRRWLGAAVEDVRSGLAKLEKALEAS